MVGVLFFCLLCLCRPCMLHVLHNSGLQPARAKASCSAALARLGGRTGCECDALAVLPFAHTHAPPRLAARRLQPRPFRRPPLRCRRSLYSWPTEPAASVQFPQTAAASIKTPVMTLPLHPGLGAEAAAELAVRLKRIRLAEALKSEPALLAAGLFDASKPMAAALVSALPIVPPACLWRRIL